MTKIVFLAVWLGAALCSGMASAAGIDCTKARMPLDALICGQPQLINDDDVLDAVYQVALQMDDDNQQHLLRLDQRHWLAQFRGACPLPGGSPDPQTTACLRKIYEDRQAHLRDYIIATAERAAKPYSLGPYTFKNLHFVYKEKSTSAEDSYRDGYRYTSDVTALQIISPVNLSTRDWNAEQLPKLDHMGNRKFHGPDPFDGCVGEDETDERVVLASTRLLTVEKDVSGYCQPAAHPFSNEESDTYVISAEGMRPLSESDLFNPGGGWEQAVIDFCVASLRRQMPDETIDEGEVATTALAVENWRLLAGAISIDFDQMPSYADGDHMVVITRDDIRAFLRPDAPFPEDTDSK